MVDYLDIFVASYVSVLVFQQKTTGNLQKNELTTSAQGANMTIGRSERMKITRIKMQKIEKMVQHVAQLLPGSRSISHKLLVTKFQR